MPVNYPPSPTDGQIVEGDGRQYQYDAAKNVWSKYGSFEPGASVDVKPTSPATGTLFYDTASPAGLEIYDGTSASWESTGASSATVTTEGTVFGATADFTGPGPFAIAALGTNISPNITGLGNTLIGYAAGEDLTSGGSNTLIGSAAGANVTTAGQMTLVGQNSGSSLFTQTGCTMLGRWNGTGVGDNIVALSDGLAAVKFYANSDGAWAAPTNTTTVPTDFGTAGQVLTSAGAAAPPTWETPTAPAPATATPTTYGTLYGFTDYNNSNTFLGGSAGELATTTSFNNICIGNNAAYSLTTGNENTIVGDYAAQNLSTGDGNVIIGQFAAPVLASGAAATNITSVGYTGFTAIPDESVILGSRTNVRFFANGSGAWSTDGTFTSFGTAGQVLTSQGASGSPVWATPSGGYTEVVTPVSSSAIYSIPVASTAKEVWVDMYYIYGSGGSPGLRVTNSSGQHTSYTYGYGAVNNSNLTFCFSNQASWSVLFSAPNVSGRAHTLRYHFLRDPNVTTRWMVDWTFNWDTDIFGSAFGSFNMSSAITGFVALTNNGGGSISGGVNVPSGQTSQIITRYA